MFEKLVFILLVGLGIYGLILLKETFDFDE